MNRILFTFICLIVSTLSASVSSVERSGQNPYIVVSCSGKSGSSTLYASFLKMGLETRHRHKLNPEDCAYILQRAQTNPVLLIDSYRDIISRKISAYFHHLATHLKMSPEEIQNAYRTNPSGYIQFLCKDFASKVAVIANFQGSEFWLPLGYDRLNDGAFDFAKKYQLKRIGNLYFLNLRFDDIASWQEIIRSLDIPIDLHQFVLVPENLSQNKWYGNIYRHFQSQVVLTQEQFDTIWNNNLEIISHFYTEEEIRKFFLKWEPHIK